MLKLMSKKIFTIIHSLTRPLKFFSTLECKGKIPAKGPDSFGRIVRDKVHEDTLTKHFPMFLCKNYTQANKIHIVYYCFRELIIRDILVKNFCLPYLLVLYQSCLADSVLHRSAKIKLLLTIIMFEFVSVYISAHVSRSRLIVTGPFLMQTLIMLMS